MKKRSDLRTDWPLYQGQYQYFRNGEPQSVSESWAIKQGSGGHLSIESLRTISATGETLTVEAIGGLESDSIHNALRLQEVYFSIIKLNYNGLGGKVKAVYSGHANGRKISHTLNSTKAAEQAVPKHDLFFPLLRIFTGPVIRRLDAVRSLQKVCTPDIRSTDKIETVFKPVISERTAKFVQQSEFRHDGRTSIADQFDYSGGEYPPGTMFYLDDRDVLLGYEWQASAEEHWRVELVETVTD